MGAYIGCEVKVYFDFFRRIAYIEEIVEEASEEISETEQINK